MSKIPLYTQAAQERYRKATLVVQMTINPRTEPNLYEFLSNKKGRATYIKRLVSKDIGIEYEGKPLIEHDEDYKDDK